MKKTKKLEFRLSLTEALVIKKNAEKAGCSVSEYLRSTALNYELYHRLTPEELEVYRTLNKYADNFRRIGNLFKQGNMPGVKELSIETAQLITKHLSKLK